MRTTLLVLIWAPLMALATMQNAYAPVTTAVHAMVHSAPTVVGAP